MEKIKVSEVSQKEYDQAWLKSTLPHIIVQELTLSEVHRILFN